MNIRKLYDFLFGWLDPVKYGTLEKIDLTFGGAGNQIMTIDGLQYATWIDYKKWPKIGERVRYTVYSEYDGLGRKMRCAHVFPEDASEPELKSV